MHKSELRSVHRFRYGHSCPLVRSHEERRWLFEEPAQSRISPSLLEYARVQIRTVLVWSGESAGASTAADPHLAQATGVPRP